MSYGSQVVEAQKPAWYQMGAYRTGGASGATGYLVDEVAGFSLGGEHEKR
jgi:hypothetical protein